MTTRTPRIVVTLGLALCLLGCSSEADGDTVTLATAPVGPCFVYWREVLLIADPTSGVVARRTQENPGLTVPVVWPVGYFGRRDGSEIVVYDGAGKERARTGMTAFIFDNDLRNEPGAVRATCLNVSMEPLGSSRDEQRRVTLRDAD